MVKRFDDAPTTLSTDAKRDLAWRQNGRSMVSAEIEQMLARRGSADLAEDVPKTKIAAAAWIMDVLLEPPAGDETIRRVPAFGGFTWQTPYRDRVVHLAKKFLRMPAIEQDTVLKYVRQGIRWRGDDPDFLERIGAAKSAGRRIDPRAIVGAMRA